MIPLDQFLRKQEEVYTRFRNTAPIQEQGTQPPAYLQESHLYGSYAVIFRHPPEIVEEVSGLSSRIARLLPVVRYDQDNMHTTLLTTDLISDFQPEDTLLHGLAERVHPIKEGLVRPQIDYRGFLFSRDSVIAAGYPDGSFVDVVNAVTSQCNDFPLAVKSTWGAHITTIRFLEKHSPAELEGFFAEMGKSKAPGQSQPIALDVGYFTVSREGFFLKTYERFPLE